MNTRWHFSKLLFLLIVFLPISIQAQSTQTIRGQVVDRDTDIPLPGVNVVVRSIQPLLGSATDVDGWFEIGNVPLGRHTLSATFLGYAPANLENVLVVAGKETVLQISLVEHAVEMGNIVVTSEQTPAEMQNDMAMVSARSFSVEETRRYAGGLDDPARMASAFAGVSSGGSVQENGMIIRGNAPKGVLWRLEGIDIPTPSHFANLSVAGGGGLTLFSHRLLANSDFYTGAFPAEYGNALSGVFDISFRQGNPSKKEHAISAGVLGLELASEGPFRKSHGGTYLFNYRYSTIGLLLALLPTEDVAQYQDLSFKLSFPLKSQGRLDFWGIGGLDTQSMKASLNPSDWEYEVWDRTEGDLNLAMGSTGLSYRQVLGPNSVLRLTSGITTSYTQIENQRVDDDQILKDDLDLSNLDQTLHLNARFDHKPAAQLTYNLGIRSQLRRYDVDIVSAQVPGEPPTAIANETGRTSLFQAFGQMKWRMGGRVHLLAGLNAQYFALNDEASLEPRFAIRHHLAPNHTLSLGYGLHSQVEDLRVYFARVENRLPNQRLPMAKAHHIVLGYDWMMDSHLRLKLEGYYQRLLRVPVEARGTYSLINFEQDFLFSRSLSSTGEGRNWGIDVTLERFFRDGYYFLLTGSFFKSDYLAGDAFWRPSRYDRRTVANGLFGKEFTLKKGNLLGINARLNLLGGKRIAPVDVLASQQQQEVVLDTSDAFSIKESTILLLDLTLTYRQNYQRASGTWALQIKNTLGAQEKVRDYNFMTRQVDAINEGYPLPVLSYTLSF